MHSFNKHLLQKAVLCRSGSQQRLLHGVTLALWLHETLGKSLTLPVPLLLHP